MGFIGAWVHRSRSSSALGFIVATAAAYGLAAPSAAHADSQTFLCTEAEQTFVVPAGITAIDVLAIGAPGGSSGTTPGGLGAMVSGQIDVDPAQTLYIEVGCAPLPGSIVGGFNGGGNVNTQSWVLAGPGGGASDVREASRDVLNSDFSRLIVAGGGGGAGAASDSRTGGAGGSAGADGGNGGGFTNGFGTGGFGGKAGTGTGIPPGGGDAGLGADGQDFASDGVDGQPGDSDDGGAGAPQSGVPRAGGGGGGGGGWGGGGGGGSGGGVFNPSSGLINGTAGGGGGGGASLVPSGGTVSLAPTGTAPSITLTWGESPSPQCSDGTDNDDDQLIDFPADPGCTSAEDGDETNVPPPTEAECNGRDATIVAVTPGEDLVGTPGPDVIVGGPGRNTISGGGGQDMICARGDDDIVDGGGGDDRVFGGYGADTIAGSDGPDRLYGEQGPDDLNGGANSDLCNGGAATDSAVGCETKQNVP